MADLAKLKVRMEADNRQLRAELTKTQKQIERFGKRTRRSITKTTNALKGLALTFVSFQTISFAVREIAQFEETMSKVSAVTGATKKQMDALTKSARKLGATTVFSAKEAAEGMEFLGRAGFETNEIIAAMPGLLDLAAAGAVDLGKAADIASNVLSGFQLAAKDSNRVADVLAATAAKSNTSVEQLGEAMAYVAPVAAAFNKSIEETAAAVGILGNAGLQASTAGTGLRKIMSALANTTPQAAAAIEALGLKVTDLNPNTNSLVDIIKKLDKAGLDAASALTIFGDRGGPAILALTSQVEDLEALSKEMGNVQGTANRMAKEMSDNLSGDFKQLQSAVTELTLSAGDSGLTGALRGATQALTDFFREAAEGEDFISQYFIDPLGDFGRTLGKTFANAQGYYADLSEKRARQIQILGAQQRELQQAIFIDPDFVKKSNEEKNKLLQQYEAIRTRRLTFIEELKGMKAGGGEGGAIGEAGEAAAGTNATADGMKKTTDATKQWTEELKLANAKLMESVGLINKQGQTLQDKIKEVRNEINNKQGETLISGTLLQVKRDLDIARSLGEKGQTKEAVEKAKSAVELTKELAEQGKISNTYANALLDNASKVGEQIIKASVKIEVDKVEALKAAKGISEEVSAASAANPTKMYIEWVSKDAPAPATQLPTDGAYRSDGTPITFNLPNGESVEVTATGNNVNDLRTALGNYVDKNGSKV